MYFDDKKIGSRYWISDGIWFRLTKEEKERLNVIEVSITSAERLVEVIK